jgi:LuxR family maltose regulon positive regulatory protein
MRLPVSAADIAALEQRTEGWIAGLHLAAIAIQDRRDVTDFVQALEASHRFIVEYLVEEVVKQLPAHLYQFLLQTAVLDRFCAPLCDAVLLGEADPHDSYSQLLIEQLERLNLFLVPIDNEQRWYRYHHLFGEALRERLQAGVSQETINRLHKRASIWYTQHAFIPDGIQHAVAATDWDFAAGLVEHYTEAYLKRGEYSTVQRWVSLLPDTVVSSRPRLGLINTAVCIWMFQLDQAQIALQHVEQSARRANLYEQFQGEVLAQQSAIAYRRMQYQEAVERAQEALAHVPLDQEALRAHVLLSLGNAANFCNQLDTALQAYAEARRLGLAAGDTHTAVRSIAEQGLIYTTQGRLHQAASTYREGLVLAAARGVDHLPMVDGLHHGLTDVLYEWNDLEAASAHLKTAIEIGERWRNPYVLRAKIDFAYILQAQGRGAIASQVIQDIIDVATKENLAPLVISANMCQVRMWLAQGDTDSAGAWLLASGLAADEGSSTKPHDLIVARVLLAQGHTKLALRLLARLHTSEQAAGRAWRLVEIIAIQALAHHASGDTALALTTLKHALVMAEAEGYIRTFVDEGEPMRRLLQEAARQNIMPQYVAKLLDAFGAPAGLHAASPAALALPEPLNEREWEVLRLIAKGHSNREIADQLVVALSTVKWHISNLYGKIGIATRTQALARARELGLL